MTDQDKKPTKPKKANKKTEQMERGSIDAVVAELEKEFGEGTVQYGRGTIVNIGVVPTGIANVDLALGVGGIPRGRLIEVFGNESGGKTTFMLQTIASCQQNNGVAAFIDAEHALDPEWAKHQGVKLEELLISQPDNGDDAIRIVETLINHGVIDLIVIDSVAALVPKEELDGEIEDHNIGAQARLMSKAMRRLAGKALKSKTAVVFINQLRDKIGGTFTPGWIRPEQTPGGRALKFYSSMRIEIKRKTVLKASERAYGVEASAKIVKSKVSPPFRSAVFKIYFGCEHQQPEPLFGVDIVSALIEAAKQLKVVTLRGSNYYIGSKRIVSGLDNFTSKLRNNNELFSEIKTEIYNKICPSVESKDITDDIPEDPVDLEE